MIMLDLTDSDLNSINILISYLGSQVCVFGMRLLQVSFRLCQLGPERLELALLRDGERLELLVGEAEAAARDVGLEVGVDGLDGAAAGRVLAAEL